jgi:hypothetical protein
MNMHQTKGKKRILPCFISLTLAAVLCFQLVNVQAAKAAGAYITYSRTVYSASDLLLNMAGDASTHDSALYITDHGMNKTGSAFFNDKVKSTDGFSTFFKFMLTNRGFGSGTWMESNGGESQKGADGLVFIVSSDANQYGSSGQGIGYQGINKSVGIEFDSFKNNDNDWEKSESHIAVDTNGQDIAGTAPLVYTLLSDDYFNSDGPFYAWIDYNASSHDLEIRISTSAVRPASATLSTTIDLSAYAGEEYYVGFTAGTGQSLEDHQILHWDFSNTYESGGLDATGSETYDMDSTPPNAPTLTRSGEDTVTLSGSTDSESGMNGYEYQIDGGDWTSGTVADISSLGGGSHTVKVDRQGRQY